MWLRHGRGWVTGLARGAILVLYGGHPMLQLAHIGRVYAAYGGIFIILSLLRGWRIDGYVLTGLISLEVASLWLER